MSTVGRLASAIGAGVHGGVGDGGPEVTSATVRAQSAGPGSLFAALPGTRAHGASFAAQAVDSGAAAVFTDPAGVQLLGPLADRVAVLVHPEPRSVLGPLSSAVYDNPSNRVPVVGVTGTSGKTTTTFLIEAALTGCGRTAGLVGTTGSRVAGEPVYSALTTPEAPEFQGLLATMADRGADAVAAEVSSHALRLGRVDGTRFRTGVFLNLSQDHLDFHPDMEDYFRAKSRLFDATADPGSRVLPAERAVVVVDDEWGRRLAASRPDAVTVSGVVGGDATWTAGESTTVGGAQTFTAYGPSTQVRVSIPMPGRFNVTNALVALAVTTGLGLDAAKVGAALAGVRVPGRLEPVERGQDFRVLVDYAHKPAAVEAVLQSVRDQAGEGRIACVLGAGGDRDSGKRPLMGAAAARVADLVVVTDDNPRSEDPSEIRAAVLGGAREAAGEGVEIREVGDRARAIAEAVDWAAPGDVVVIAGKGHETGQEAAGVVHPFDDRVHAIDEIDRRLRAAGEDHAR